MGKITFNQIKKIVFTLMILITAAFAQLIVSINFMLITAGALSLTLLILKIVKFLKEKETILKVLKIALDNIDMIFSRSQGGVSGLCYLFTVLWENNKITHTEMLLAKQYISDNAPAKRFKAYRGFWFAPYESEPRKQWLEVEIKKLNRFLIIKNKALY